jgi:hypothetical protein
MSHPSQEPPTMALASPSHTALSTALFPQEFNSHARLRTGSRATPSPTRYSHFLVVIFLLSNYLLIIRLTPTDIPTDTISFIALLPPFSTFTTLHVVWLPFYLNRCFGECGDGETMERHRKRLMTGNVLLGAALVSVGIVVRKIMGKRMTLGQGLAMGVVGLLIGIEFIFRWNFGSFQHSLSFLHPCFLCLLAAVLWFVLARRRGARTLISSLPPRSSL